ncbi:MAG: PilZ domain-containing protein [Novosphingobium sp.]
MAQPGLDNPSPKVSPRLEDRFPERRKDVRFITIYRLVKVEHAGDEGLGRCRNISDSGARLELYMDLHLGSRIRIVFAPGDEVTGRVIWLNGHEYGVAFDRTIDCMDVLGHSSHPDGIEGPRPPRLKTSLPAKVAYAGGVWDSTVSDISLRGMRITGGSFEAGRVVRVMLENGRECEGVIRWSHGNVAGVMLTEPLPVEELGSVRRLSGNYY